MPVFYVYILRCIGKNGKISLYTGSTQDLLIRFDQHQTGRGGAKYTHGKDLDLVFFETYTNRSDAMKREYEIKQFTASKKHQLIEDFQKRVRKE